MLGREAIGEKHSAANRPGFEKLQQRHLSATSVSLELVLAYSDTTNEQLVRRPRHEHRVLMNGLWSGHIS